MAAKVKRPSAFAGGDPRRLRQAPVVKDGNWKRLKGFPGWETCEEKGKTFYRNLSKGCLQQTRKPVANWVEQDTSEEHYGTVRVAKGAMFKKTPAFLDSPLKLVKPKAEKKTHLASVFAPPDTSPSPSSSTPTSAPSESDIPIPPHMRKPRPAKKAPPDNDIPVPPHMRKPIKKAASESSADVPVPPHMRKPAPKSTTPSKSTKPDVPVPPHMRRPANPPAKRHSVKKGPIRPILSSPHSSTPKKPAALAHAAPRHKPRSETLDLAVPPHMRQAPLVRKKKERTPTLECGIPPHIRASQSKAAQPKQEKPAPKVAPETTPTPAVQMEECPLCEKQIPLHAMDAHIDACVDAG